MGRLFKAEYSKLEFINLGYVTSLGKINSQINALNQIYDALRIQDFIRPGYKDGINNNVRSKRVGLQKSIFETIGNKISKLLNDYVLYSVAFMNKVSKKHLLFKTGQDFTFTDENWYTTFIYWVPSIDLNIQIGTSRYVPSRSKFFDRVFKLLPFK